MKKYNLLIICLLLLLLFSCKKNQSNPCPTFWGYKLPYSLFFKLNLNGNRLADSVLNKLKLSYYQNGSKKYISDFSRAINEGSLNAFDSGIMVTRDIGFNSGDANIKDYYLEFPDGDIDTLFVDYRKYSQCEADTSVCQCLYPLYSVHFNGQKASPDAYITEHTVYLFEKK
jgi:hypothetical protein